MATFEEYRTRREYLLIYAELIAAARYRGVVTYQHLARLVGLPLTGSYMGKEIGIYLGAVSDREHALGRPLLSAVAISTKDTPGSGFFSIAKQLGKYTGGTHEDDRAFWSAEQEAVYETWKPAFPEHVKGEIGSR
jgi:hypothetical protein